MKKCWFAFCLCMLWACGGSESGYVIEGTLPSAKYDGEWIYLIPLEHASPETVDSVRISNASFTFSGKGEQVRLLRMQPLLRMAMQDLLVVTEPGTLRVWIDTVSRAKGTPQNETLQRWKEEREKNLNAHHAIRQELKIANKADSLQWIQARDTLRMKEQEFNFQFLKEHGNTTAGNFIRKMTYSSLTKEQQEALVKELP